MGGFKKRLKGLREARGCRNFGREFLESLFTGNPLIHKSLERLLPPPTCFQQDASVIATNVPTALGTARASVPVPLAGQG